MLLEAANVKNGSAPTDQQLHNALEAVSTFHDRNRPDGDGMQYFGHQEKNETSGIYYSQLVNIYSYEDARDKFLSFFMNYTTDEELVNILSDVQLHL